ncbi:hypothetical protein MRBLWO14_001166 [Microbacterium sp. LWO14-1.2]|uniref:hypothetical protein n=1 Tax=Microbacterium sp. LWO14-1.2 TaxID=3135263 RepID=UPI0031397948
MRLDVRASRELLAAIYAIRSLDRTIAKLNRQQTKRVAGPEWKKALSERADTRLEHRVIVDTAVVSVSDQNVRIQSAGKGRPLTGGFNPKTDYHATEFGADRDRRTTYRRKSRKGGTHEVTRRAATAMKPRNSSGYVFFPAAKEMIPRMARLWVQTTVRTIATAFEGKQE